MKTDGDTIDKLFEIKKLICQYSTNRKVLEVDNLVIERGKITAILGLSGIGKSTILETLGLMNRTLPRDSHVLFYPSRDAEPIDYSTLWYESSEKIRSGIRKKHFSFIFQESNLMHNFTALDNVCIALMLRNEPKEIAKVKIMKYLHEMELEMKVSDKTMIYNLSGGERQRLSFIRAIAPDFTVLFGDEPTGNLDVVNASRVINNLSKTIKEKGKSAIIVTHDIRLSVEYADDIILIAEEKENETLRSFGKITGNNVYKSTIIEGKKLWRNHIVTDWQDNNWMEGEIRKIFEKAITEVTAL